MKLFDLQRRMLTVGVSIFTAVLAIGLLMVPASAIVIERDLDNPNDGFLTFDSGTNLEWLDVTLTTGQSYNSVAAGFGGFIGSGGFRFATTDEVGTFFTNAGLLNILGNNLILDRVAAEALVNLLGVSEIIPSGNTAFFATRGWADLVPIGTQASLSSVNFNPGNNTGFAQASGSTSLKSLALAGVGSFLIRDAAISVVPLPAALPLFGTGLAIMGFIGWRRKQKDVVEA